MTNVEAGRTETVPGRMLARAAGDLDGALCLLDAAGEARDWSGVELLEHAAAWSRFYRERGLEPGDRVVIILEHSPELYFAFHGALLGGFVPSMFAFPSPKFKEQEYFRTFSTLWQIAEPRLLVTSGRLRARLEAHDLGEVEVCEPAEVTGRVSETEAHAAAVDPDDVAFIQYSSGTTGIKKGVAINHRALLWQVDAYAQEIRLDAGDVIVSWLPLYHDMGLVACMLLPLLRKVPLVAMSPFDWVRRPAMLLEAISRHGGTLCWLPNFAYNFLARNVAEQELAGIDLSSLRGVVNCSETVLDNSHTAFLERFAPLGLEPEALCVSYAMAENTFAVTSGGFESPLVVDAVDGDVFSREGRAEPAGPETVRTLRLVSSGRALPETSIEILSDTDQPLPERRVGEIVLSSPCLLERYWRNREATAKALRDGRYATGDLGYLADGELFVTGRKSDLIIIGGKNIYPADVESRVHEIEGVIAGRAVACGVRDPQAGTEVLVILAETHEADPARREALREAIFDAVTGATEVVPHDIRLLEHMWLIKSSAGKLARGENRRRYLELVQQESPPAATAGAASPVEAGAEPTRDELTARVRDSIRRVLGSRPFGDGDPLLSSGRIDSFHLAALGLELETRCAVHIPPGFLGDVERFDTVGLIAETMEILRRGGELGQPRIERHQAPRCRDDIAMRLERQRRPLFRAGFWTWIYRLRFLTLGVRVGSRLRVLGPLLLRLEGDPKNLVIGDDVTLLPWVDLKNRENGRIVLGDGVVLDTSARLVAANDALLELGDDARFAMGGIVNAGDDVCIGRRTLVAGSCSINASDHEYDDGYTSIMEQGYVHEPVLIGEDVWIGAQVIIGRGSRIGDGAVIGANSVVQGEIEPYAVAVGNPARVMKFRKR